MTADARSGPPREARMDWLGQLLKGMPVAVWSMDATGRITHSEGAALEFLGFEPGELVGASYFDLYAERVDVLEFARRALAGESVRERVEVEGRLFETRMLPLRDDAGAVSEVIAVSIDVTERARDEHELERRGRLLLALASIAQRFLSSGEFEAAVRRMLELLGQATGAERVFLFENETDAQGELLADLRWEWVVAQGPAPRLGDPALRGVRLFSDPYQELAVPLAWGEPVTKGVEELREAVAELLGAPDARSLLVVPLFAGETFWGFLGFEDRRDQRLWSAEEIGALRAAAALFAAAWQRHRFESELKESEEKYRELVENATDAVWSIDLEGRFLSVNHALASLLGYSQEEIVGSPWERFIVEEDQRELVRRAIREKIVEGRARTFYETRLRTRSGDFVDVEVSSRLVERDGAPVAIHGTGRDVTERRGLEDQLRQAVKLEAVGRLAGGVAHDFNNLLTAIQGYSERILSRLKPSDPMRGEVMEILKAGERAADLTRELMAFSRRQPARPRDLDLNHLIERRLDMLRRIVGEDVVVLNLAESRVGAVHADPSMVEQVLVNLSVNARDAMPEGGRIEISTAVAVRQEIVDRGVQTVPDPSYVRLSLRDTGEGMDAETLARIFEPFFTTKELGKGSGLGLSTVYGIVKQCAGFIFADSHPGQGTVFHVYLPRAESAAPAGPELEAAAPDAGPVRETILLVEDEDMIRSLAEQILVDRGYRVYAASNANEAIEIAGRLRDELDLLLTDIVMPGTSGSDLAQRLLRDRPNLHVLYMSGYSDSLIFRYGMLQENSAFLQKPFSADVLERRVRELLDG
ncbi:MAG: PAS domain S-box protein [Acidobacteria bacterium]|nr:PAS domain S-box protein [Acidobacteriota bacterium]MCB9378270.1 PAS domain S-box protein [Holophagales bacterium]